MNKATSLVYIYFLALSLPKKLSFRLFSALKLFFRQMFLFINVIQKNKYLGNITFQISFNSKYVHEIPAQTLKMHQ